MAGLDGFVTPAVQQLEQRFLVWHELLQRLATKSWNDPADQPTGQTEFNCRDQSRMLIEGDEGSAEVILGSRHATLHRLQRRWCHLTSPPAP